MICLLCAGPLKAARSALCPGCLADLPRIATGCLRCGRPLLLPALCGECAVRPPLYDRAIACFEYSAPIDSIIREFKYAGRLCWAPFLAQCLAATVQAAGSPRPDRLLPVPLHWRRRYLRGFNQSAELARVLGRMLDIPVDQKLAHRCRATNPQAGLQAAQRGGNVRRAFAVRRPAACRRVAVIEDVITTGATVSELSRELKRAGIAEIQIWAVARSG